MTQKWITFDTLDSVTVGLRPSNIISTLYSVENNKGFIHANLNGVVNTYTVSASTISAINDLMKKEN